MAVPQHCRDTGVNRKSQLLEKEKKKNPINIITCDIQEVRVADDTLPAE